MKALVVQTCCITLVSLMSCGGQVTSEPETEEPETWDSDAGQAGPNFNEYELAKCGFALGPGEPCDWFVPSSGHCYATKEQACACACPRDRDSTCVSGFYAGSNGRTRVSCY